MKKIRLTKSELKKQKDELKRFRRYLPALYIKKKQLRLETLKARRRIAEGEEELESLSRGISPWIGLFAEDAGLEGLLGPAFLELDRENSAGAILPVLRTLERESEKYDPLLYPLWTDSALRTLREVGEGEARLVVLRERARRLERELRVVSQRVNLFENIKIPRAEENIKRINVYLADRQTAAFGWSLIAKRRRASRENP